jgi:hypothetical protein
MKLSRLFVIALLAGTLGVFGCSDDPPSNGNGGSGGSAGSGGTGGGDGADIGCDEGDCLTDTALQEQCEQLVTACIARDINEAECIAAGLLVLCNDGTGGTGGSGGTAGTGGTGGTGGTAGTGGTGGTAGTGGTGGTGGAPDPDLVCNEGLCADPGEAKEDCKVLVATCIERDLNVDECIAGVLLLVCKE